ILSGQRPLLPRLPPRIRTFHALSSVTFHGFDDAIVTVLRFHADASATPSLALTHSRTDVGVLPLLPSAFVPSHQPLSQFLDDLPLAPTTATRDSRVTVPLSDEPPRQAPCWIEPRLKPPPPL